MNKHGLFQAKDIDDRFFLECVLYIQYEPRPPGDCCASPWSVIPHWAHTTHLDRMMPMFPTPVIIAKAAALIKRGLLTGCTCGCRGDFELTDKGLEFLG